MDFGVPNIWQSGYLKLYVDGQEVTPPFNILIPNILLGVLNIFLFLFKASNPIYLLLINQTTNIANFLWLSCDICFAPWTSTSGKRNKSLQLSRDSHCELDEYCLAYNGVQLWLIEFLYIQRKMWLKLI